MKTDNELVLNLFTEAFEFVLDETISLSQYDHENIEELATIAAPLRLEDPTPVVPSPNDFVFSRTIGEGGMGVVDAAMQLSLRREVALKRLRVTQRNEFFADNLTQEALLLAKLDHPNITPIHLITADEEGAPMFAMKLIEGHSWLTLLSQPEHPFWEQIVGDRLEWNLRTLVQVCNAVSYAHSKGILHLDIKAENVMIGHFGEVFLIDWGVAMMLDASGNIQRRVFAGTLSHAAPEMFLRHAPLTPKTDVFLLGVTLHELITGQTFRAEKTLKDLLKSTLSVEKVELTQIQDPELKQICSRAIEANPDERYSSVVEFSAAIQDHLTHRSALETLHAGERLLNELQFMEPVPEHTERTFQQLAYQCKFAFEEALRQVELPAATNGLCEVLTLMFRHELSKGDLHYARLHLNALREIASDDTYAELKHALQETMKRKLRSDELATQIQYKLMEELKAKSEKE